MIVHAAATALANCSYSWGSYSSYRGGNYVSNYVYLVYATTAISEYMAVMPTPYTQAVLHRLELKRMASSLSPA